MIHVELIGCTSAGKSTLTRALVNVCAQKNLRATTADALILHRTGLSFLRNHFVRERVIDLVALVNYVRRWRLHCGLVAFSSSAIRELSIGTVAKLNTLRNVIRKIGISEFVQLYGKDHDIVFVDNDGILQAAHNLFVHVAAKPNDVLVSEFARLSPTPTVTVYLRQSARVLESRTIARGHKRVPDGSPHMAGLFVSRAVEVFDRLSAEPSVSQNLVVVDGENQMDVQSIGCGEARISTVAQLVRRAAADVCRPPVSQVTTAPA